VHALLGHEAVGVWNFDEGADTTCYDISGYGNNGTIHGDPDWVLSDINGYLLSFDGTGDYVEISDNDLLDFGDENFTLEAWVYNNEKVANKAILTKTTGYSDSLVNYALDQSAINGWRFRVGGGSNMVQSLTGYEIEEWVHVVGVYRQGGYYANIELFINGNSVAVKTGVDSPIPNIGGLYIGSYYITNSFSGLIDEVRIYSEALPSTEIQKHYVKGLEKLLANQAITQAEYDQRMEEFNKSLVSK
jgi:hypothetical protein